MKAALLLSLLLAACGGGGSTYSDEPVPMNVMDPAGWEIANSVGVPVRPLLHPDGFSIDIPYDSTGHVNYITVPTGSLAGKTKVTLRARLEMADGVKLEPVNDPRAPSLMTLYFQRKGDDWTAGNEAYRWFASFGTVANLKAGEYVIEARFDANWTAVLTSSRANNPAGYTAAINDAGRIGFVLGGGDGLGHGVFATGPARLVVTSFKVD